ncbi:MAG: nucleotidyltransferase substrate binding protein [Acidobacteriaceae bacterium]
MIKLTPLTNAVQRLKEGVVQENDPENSLLRDGLIQRFEFMNELSHKLLRRYLESTAADPDDVRALTFEGLIRLGDEQKLLMSDVSQWKKYRKARTDTSHTYDEKAALEIIPLIPTFIREAQFLLEHLKERTA